MVLTNSLLMSEPLLGPIFRQKRGIYASLIDSSGIVGLHRCIRVRSGNES
jgi:hypothetical protein